MKMNLVFIGYVHCSGDTKGAKFREEKGDRTILIKPKPAIIGAIYESDVTITKGEFSSFRGLKYVGDWPDEKQVEDWKAESWTHMENLRAALALKKGMKEAESIDKMRISEAKERCGKDWRFREAFKGYVINKF